jgi:hypothetical protein
MITAQRIILLLSALLSIAPVRTIFAADSLSSVAAISLAERFVFVNGYTNALENEIVKELDVDIVELHSTRKVILQTRRNTLKPKAIGIKPVMANGKQIGWGVAFDYALNIRSDSCRVVTMNVDGSETKMQHQDGIRSYWAGIERK